jgi:tetratricopeptide (TPR) repeat protein
MSEIVHTPAKPQKSYTKTLVVVLSILLLLLVYGAGIFILPMSVSFSYQSRNCDSILILHKIYTSLYPNFIEDKTLLSPAQECEAYNLAVSNEAMGSWQEAYDAYQAYSSAYPNGLYANEAHQQSAVALINLAQDQIEQQRYEEALVHLNLITASYSDTDVITDAWNLFPSVYTRWGKRLREAGDFTRSEQILNDFMTWSLTNQKGDNTTDAQRELAQTYSAWGLDLQSQNQFENALAKFELAVSADPQSQFDSTAAVKSGQSRLYVEWGNDLLEQDQFSVAIEKFKLAVSKSDGTDDHSAGDALANGQIQWAHRLSAEEDFLGALEHVGFAEEAAASETMKKSVDAALQDTYIAFSKSSGSQARQAMQDALAAVCEKQKVPDLPIFGLNKDSIRLGIYGVDDQLPENLAAKTPGEMHYVACVIPDNRTIESRYYREIVLKVTRGYYYTLVEQFRVQVTWNIDLLKIDTSQSVAKQGLTGELPPPFAENGNRYFYGPTPIDELVLWLPSAID